jgi:hypothetical protein
MLCLGIPGHVVLCRRHVLGLGLAVCPSIPKAAVESTSSCSYARTRPQSVTRGMITQTRSQNRTQVVHVYVALADN